MYNQEHYDILQRSVGDWNHWRQKNQDVAPDLRGANLRRAILSGANLSGVNLCGADLTEAMLSSVDLRGAELSGALLGGVLLSRADLGGATLCSAVLDEADLRRTKLIDANLNDASLRNSKFDEADLTRANLNGVDLTRASLARVITNDVLVPNTKVLETQRTYFNKANLTDVNLDGANLRGCQFVEADLSRARLYGANLYRANFTGAILRKTDLRYALLIETNFEKSVIEDCSVYGAAVWNLKTGGATQSNLIITHPKEATITVDNLGVSQFIHLLLNYQDLRDVINTITSKAVLILGRFTPERKVILDALREELRNRNYLPILFDFDKPSSRNLTETVSTLAHIARFIIADITDAKSIPQELQRIVPTLPSLPVQPLLLSSQQEYGMFNDFMDYPWVLPVYRYENQETLFAALQEKVISPAEAKADEIEERRKAFEKGASIGGTAPVADIGPGN